MNDVNKSGGGGGNEMEAFHADICAKLALPITNEENKIK